LLKKLILILCIFITAGLNQSELSSVHGAPREVAVVLDGRKLAFDMKPYIIDGTTLVPLRNFFEQLEAVVKWDQETKSVTVFHKDVIFKLAIDGKVVYKNDQSIPIRTPPQISDNTLYISIRELAEIMHFTVGWEENLRTVIVSTVPKKELLVIKVIDGFTFSALLDGKEEMIRLNGLTTMADLSMENEETINNETLDFVRARIENNSVWLEHDGLERDEQGRILGYIYNKDGSFLNSTLLANGYAQTLGSPRNLKWGSFFHEAVIKTRDRKIGLWGTPGLLESLSNGESGNVRIGSIDLKYEIVRIINPDSMRQRDLSGWKIVEKESNHTFIFPEGFVLTPQETVVILSGPMVGRIKSSNKTLIWSEQSVWNKDGDGATLYDEEGYVMDFTEN
jgi:endonuclease YncB( thermonuclease family)